jgi:hypothetical protein
MQSEDLFTIIFVELADLFAVCQFQRASVLVRGGGVEVCATVPWR